MAPLTDSSSPPRAFAASLPRAALPAALPFQQAAAMSLAALQSAMGELVDALPYDTRKAADVGRALGVDAKLGWQVHKIATSLNPLALGTNVPVPVSVLRLLKAGSRLGVSEEILARVSDACDNFERMVEDYAGDRERFASMIAGLVRDEAEDLDLKYKKAAYRAMSHLRGVDMRAYVRCFMLHPGASPDMLDAAIVGVAVGLNQLRSTAPLILPLGKVRTCENLTSERYSQERVDPIPGAEGAFFLRDYCSPPPPTQVSVLGSGTTFPALEFPEGVGRKQSVTIATAAITQAQSPFATPGPPWIAHMPKVVLPSEVLVADTLIHKDAFPARHPLPRDIKVFDNERVGPGYGEPNHTERTDLLTVREDCEYRGLGIDLVGLPAVPNYPDMVKAVCAAQGWNPDEFHVYRCLIQYPILHSTLRIVFDLAK